MTVNDVEWFDVLLFMVFAGAFIAPVAIVISEVLL